jgi:hypothetical protein
VLDAFHHGSVDGYPNVTAIIAESKQLQEFQDLFEMYVSDFLVLTRCSEELLYLKSLWDMVRTTGGHAPDMWDPGGCVAVVGMHRGSCWSCVCGYLCNLPSDQLTSMQTCPRAFLLLSRCHYLGATVACRHYSHCVNHVVPWAAAGWCCDVHFL